MAPALQLEPLSFRRRKPLFSGILSAVNGLTSSEARRSALYWVRQLDASAIAAIGFDLDFTLAPYDISEIISFMLREAAHRLDIVPPFEQPDTILYRGDLIDTTAGRILRTDPFGVALQAWSLDRVLTPGEIAREYGDFGPISAGARFVAIDSFYNFADAILFLNLCATQQPHEDPSLAWRDTKAVIDDIHDGGFIYRAIEFNPDKFISPGHSIRELIGNIRASHRQSFLVSNAPAHFAASILASLDTPPESFDFAVLEANKPQFFRSSAPLIDVPRDEFPFAKSAYRGGSLESLESSQGLRGRQILFVGDHVYSDIIRASRLRGWRTLLIVPELLEDISAPFRTASGALTNFGWQAVRFAWGYAASAHVLTDLQQLQQPSQFSIILPHEQ